MFPSQGKQWLQGILHIQKTVQGERLKPCFPHTMVLISAPDKLIFKIKQSNVDVFSGLAQGGSL